MCADPEVRGVRRNLASDTERWRAYLGCDDLDEPAELVFYCAEFAEREFRDA
jgi:hypothetical protein